MKKCNALLALFLLFALFPALECSAWVGMVTGSKTGTYIQFGNDIARVAGQEGLDIRVKESEGSLANIERMNSKENAAFGIVQSDVLGILEMKQPQVAEKLRLIYPFYNEEVHILARKDIKSIKDLEGKRIATGTRGSGNWLTISNLLYMMNVKPGEKITDMKPIEALTAVLQGEIDAMVYVAGKPVGLFEKLNKFKKESKFAGLLKNVHFVPINEPRILKKFYVPSQITPSDYTWMNRSVPTVAVKALLVSFDFSEGKSAYFKERCGQLKILGRAIRDNLSQLKRNGHPKWKTVNLNTRIGQWKLDACSHGGGGGTPRKASPGDKNELYNELKGMFE